MNEIADLLGNNSVGNSFFSGLGTLLIAKIKDNSKDEVKGTVDITLLSYGSAGKDIEAVPILRPYAGKDYGFYYQPEKDDIVLVGFVGNNMQKPVILGCLYPANAGFVNESFIKENTKRHFKFKQGFDYTESDEDNKQSLTVASPKGLTEIIEDEKETISLKDKNGKNLLKIDSKNGAVELTADKKITLKAGRCTITMDGQRGSVEIKADKISLAANQQVDIKGNSAANLGGAQVKIEGQAMVEVKSGAMVQVSGSLIKLG
jgi:uncharacterized protein involved in type VI secretion and phage assembly